MVELTNEAAINTWVQKQKMNKASRTTNDMMDGYVNTERSDLKYLSVQYYAWINKTAIKAYKDRRQNTAAILTSNFVATDRTGLRLRSGSANSTALTTEMAQMAAVEVMFALGCLRPFRHLYICSLPCAAFDGGSSPRTPPLLLRDPPPMDLYPHLRLSYR